MTFRRRKIDTLVLILTTLLLAALPLALAHESGTSAYPVRLNSDGTYLVDKIGQPFFMNGDTAWSLIAQSSKADAELYLSNRANKVFNTVLVNLIEHAFAANAPADSAGDMPFSLAGDFDSPNESYFAHADWVINKAAENGILVMLAPLYLGYECGPQGWCAETRASSLATMRNYGRYIGKRYKDFPNIIWVIGGDTDPVASGVGAHVREFVAGIREVGDRHLFTAHDAPEQSAMDVWPNESWLSLNNVYTYGDTAPVALAQFNRTGAKPFFLLETYYEREHGSTPLGLRRQAYWTVLSGGVIGHVFGNCPLWNFNAPSASSFCASASWKSQLDSVGSNTLVNVGRLFRSRAFFKLVPDQTHVVMTNGFQSGTTYAATARTSDGSTVIAYIPTRRNVTVDLSQIAGGSANAWWFNPRTALATPAGQFPTSGSVVFIPPDFNDWVLVIDNAALGLPAPGAIIP